MNLLKSLKPRSILFMDGGDDTFYTLAYLTMAEGKREDLELHDRGGLIYRNPYGDDFRNISKTEKRSRRQNVESAFLGVRPVYYATFNKHALDGTVFLPRGLLYQAVARPQLLQPEINLRVEEDYRKNGSMLWGLYSTRLIYETLPYYPFRIRLWSRFIPASKGLKIGIWVASGARSPLAGISRGSYPIFPGMFLQGL